MEREARRRARRDPPQELSARIARLEEEQARLLAGLAAGEQRFRHLARSVWRVQEEERRRLARELHDSLGQTLTALRLRLEQLRLELAAASPAAAAQLGEVSEVVGSALAETRELARLLRPPVLDELGLEAALRWLVRRFREAGLAVEARLAGFGGKLPADFEIVVFRLAQEALNNVSRHAQAASAVFEARIEEGRLQMAIFDSGRGFSPEETPSGFGLRGMRDRVESFGGELRVRSQRGAGTRIEVSLPLPLPPTEETR